MKTEHGSRTEARKKYRKRTERKRETEWCSLLSFHSSASSQLHHPSFFSFSLRRYFIPSTHNIPSHIYMCHDHTNIWCIKIPIENHQLWLAQNVCTFIHYSFIVPWRKSNSEKWWKKFWVRRRVFTPWWRCISNLLSILIYCRCPQFQQIFRCHYGNCIWMPWFPEWMEKGGGHEKVWHYFRQNRRILYKVW